MSNRTLAFDTVFIRGFTKFAGRPLALDPESGVVYSADARRGADGCWTIATSLPPLGSRLFVIPRQQSVRRYPKLPHLVTVRTTTLSKKSWNISLSEENALVLDRPHFSIGGGREREPEEILRIDNRVRKALGLKPRGGEMVQPWAREKQDSPPAIRVRLRYVFEVKALPSGRLLVGIEQPKRFSISLNGTPLDVDLECGWWTDRSLRTIPADPSTLHLGKNELVLEGHYDQDHPGLEIVYLLGSFGVAVKGVAVSMSPAPTTLVTGDWVRQGLAFYGGNVGYTAAMTPKLGRGERLFVHVPGYLGTAVRVLVDGREARVFGWEPGEAEITGLVASGRTSVLCIEIIGHRRNSHGPLHLAGAAPRWTGPGEFKTEKERWTDGYCLIPAGLTKSPELLYKKEQTKR